MKYIGFVSPIFYPLQLFGINHVHRRLILYTCILLFFNIYDEEEQSPLIYIRRDASIIKDRTEKNLQARPGIEPTSNALYQLNVSESAVLAAPPPRHSIQVNVFHA